MMKKSKSFWEKPKQQTFWFLQRFKTLFYYLDIHDIFNFSFLQWAQFRIFMSH